MRILGLLILALSATTAFAQNDSAEAKLALQLYDLLEIEATVTLAITHYANSLDLDDQQRQEIRSTYRREVSATMAKVYTRDELAALRTFYASPVGRSVISKQPAIGKEYADILIRVLSAYRDKSKGGG